MGYSVLAVEPVGELRVDAKRFYPNSHVRRLDDSLPDLKAVRATATTFRVVVITAVWMHLDQVGSGGNRNRGVTWTRLAFRKQACSG